MTTKESSAAQLALQPLVETTWGAGLAQTARGRKKYRQAGLAQAAQGRMKCLSSAVAPSSAALAIRIWRTSK